MQTWEREVSACLMYICSSFDCGSQSPAWSSISRRLGERDVGQLLHQDLRHVLPAALEPPSASEIPCNVPNVLGAYFVQPSHAQRSLACRVFTLLRCSHSRDLFRKMS